MFMRIVSLPTLLALLCGCQSYVAVPVQPMTLVAVAQRSKVRVATKADVLLVVDDSPSMSGKQDRLAAALQNFTSAAPSLEPVANYVNFLRGLKNADGSLKEIEIGAIVSLKDGTLDPGVCANPSCDAACDTPAATAACDARCSTAPTYRICMADCASLCHTFCGGEVPVRDYTLSTGPDGFFVKFQGNCLLMPDD